MAELATHLVDQGASHTRCGIKVTSSAALPYCDPVHAPMHVEGRDMVVCWKCEAADEQA